MDQDASGCGYFLRSKQLAGCTEYGMTHNVEGAPRREDAQRRGAPCTPRAVALALSHGLTQAS